MFWHPNTGCSAASVVKCVRFFIDNKLKTIYMKKITRKAFYAISMICIIAILASIVWYDEVRDTMNPEDAMTFSVSLFILSSLCVVVLCWLCWLASEDKIS